MQLIHIDNQPYYLLLPKGKPKGGEAVEAVEAPAFFSRAGQNYSKKYILCTITESGDGEGHVIRGFKIYYLYYNK